MKDFRNTESRYLILFLVISGFGIAYFFLFMAFDKDFDAFRWLIMEHNYNWEFTDFFQPIVYSIDLEKTYFNSNIAYPPLIVCFFHILWMMNPIRLPIHLKSWNECANYQFNMLILLMIVIVQIIALFLSINKILHAYGEKKVSIFFFLIIFSAPFFAGAIERGNIALAVVPLLLFALYFKDSENERMKEVALILIAIATGIKIYPAIFGLLYLREKRWKEACRLLFYGLVVFFIPFIFTGGVDGIVQYMKILITSGRGNPIRWTSIRCFFSAICQYLEWNIDSKIIGSYLEKIFLLISVLVVFITNRQWKQILFLSGIMAVYVPNSYRYTSVYMLIPLVFALRDLRQYSNNKFCMDYIYISLFATVFTIPIWFSNGEVDFAIFLPIYLILLFCTIESMISFFKNVRTVIYKVRNHVSKFRMKCKSFFMVLKDNFPVPDKNSIYPSGH